MQFLLGRGARQYGALLLALVTQAGCLSETTITGLDVGHSSLLITPINQPYRAHTVATAQLQLRRDDDHPLAQAPVLFHSERCLLDPNQATTDAAGRATVQVAPTTAQGCSVDAVVLFQGTQTPVPTTAAVDFYLPADGNAAVLPGQQLDLQATARRADATVDSTYTGTVHVTATDGNATLPLDYTFTASDYGNKIWLAGLVLRTSGVQSVRIADAATGQPLQPDLQMEVQASQAISMQLQANPVTVAGAPYSVLVRVVDGYGDKVKGYTGTVKVTSSDPCATLPAPVTFTAADAGSKQLDNLVWRTSGQQLLQVTDTQNDALLGQALVAVGPAPAYQLRIAAVDSSVAGLSLGMGVEVVDAYGNVAPMGTAQLSFSSTDLQATLPVDTRIDLTDSGRTTVSGLVLVTAGDQNVAVTDLQGALPPATHGVHVDAAAASQLVLDTNTQARAGAAQDVRVRAFDTYHNAAVGFTSTVTFAGSDPGGQYPVAYRFGSQDAGSHLFAGGMTYVTAGDQNLRVSVLGGGLQASVPHVAVAPADANRFVLSGLASVHVACVSESATVTVFDAYGNLVSDYAGTLSLSSAYNTVTLPTSVSLSASDGGSKAFSGVTPRITGTGDITVSNGQVTSSQALQIQSGAPTWLELANLSRYVTPGNTQATVVAHDACNNVATQFTDTVHFTSSDPNAQLPQDYAFTAGDNGQRGFGIGFFTLDTQSLTVADATQSQVSSASASTYVFYPCVGYGQSMNIGAGGVAQSGAGVGGSFTVPFVGLDGSQNPTAAWVDSRSGEARVFVASYNPGSQNWAGLGGSAVGLGLSSLDGTAGPPGLAMWNNQPWVAWTNQASSAIGTSLQLEAYSSSWAGLGSNANDSSAAPGISGSAAVALDRVQLAVSSAGAPYVAWRNTADGSIRLRTFAGARWLGLGGTDVVSVGPDASDGGVALALTSSGLPVVAWQAKPGSVQQIYVARWSGTSWQGLAGSNSGTGISNASSAAAHPALVLDANDRPWVAWDVVPSSNREIYALHWNGSSWSELAGSASNGGISANASDSIAPTLALASNNLPVVAWEDSASGNHAIFLKRYDGSAWSGVQRSDAGAGVSGQFANSFTRPQMVIDSSDRPVLAFTTNNAALVCRWASVVP